MLFAFLFPPADMFRYTLPSRSFSLLAVRIDNYTFAWLWWEFGLEWRLDG